MSGVKCPISLSTLVSQEFGSVQQTNRRKSSSTSQIYESSYGGVEMLDIIESRMFVQLFDLIILTYHLVLGIGRIVLELGWNGFQFLTSSIVDSSIMYSIPIPSPLALSIRRESDNYYGSLLSSPSDDICMSPPEDRRKSSLFENPLMDIDAVIERVANDLAEVIHQSLNTSSNILEVSSKQEVSIHKIEKTLSMKMIERVSSESEQLVETMPLTSMTDSNNVTTLSDSFDEVVQLQNRLNQFVFPPYYSPSK